MKTLLKEISELDDETVVDCMWMVLKYKSAGIMRKLKAMAFILDLDENTVLEEAPKDSAGRILDHETRHLIHDILIKK